MTRYEALTQQSENYQKISDIAMEQSELHIRLANNRKDVAKTYMALAWDTMGDRDRLTVEEADEEV